MRGAGEGGGVPCYGERSGDGCDDALGDDHDVGLRGKGRSWGTAGWEDGGGNDYHHGTGGDVGLLLGGQDRTGRRAPLRERSRGSARSSVGPTDE